MSIFEDIMKQFEKQVFNEGEIAEKIKTTKNLINEEFGWEFIYKINGVTKEQYEQWTK